MSTSKRIGITIIILIAFVCLFFTSCAVIMFLAPGTEIFGVRYVSALVGNYEKDVSLETFHGDLYIDTEGVPITIDFTNYYTYSVSFHQNFTGFTTSHMSQANLELDYKENGDLKIKTSEFVKFIYAKEDYDAYHFDLKIPAYYFRDGNRSIYINSNNSSVKIIGSPVLDTFGLKTNGKLNIEGLLTTEALLKLDLGSSITIDETYSCEFLDISTTSNNTVNISNNVSGDINIKAVGGDVKLQDCRNLNVQTSSGAVRCTGVVSGNVNIETSSGDVELGKVNQGEGEKVTSIKTKSGFITVDELKNGQIETYSGKITINNSDNLNIKTTIGQTFVKNNTNNIEIEGKNGYVTLGEDGSLNNVKVNTTTGIIKVYNTSGEVNIESVNNDVTFKNLTSNKITLKAGKKVKAEKLMGDVTIKSNGDTYLQFEQISANVSVDAGSKANQVDIYATSAPAGSVSYVLRSTKGEKVQVYAGEELIAEKSIISNIESGQYQINATSVYAKIRLYLGA